MTTSPQPESPEPLKVAAYRVDWPAADSVGRPRFYGADDTRRMNNHTSFVNGVAKINPLCLLSDAESAIQAARNEAEAMRADAERLRSLINTPHTDDWVTASKLEAAHQIERWSAGHDAGKQPEDWFWLLGYLGGKAVAAFRAGNKEKGLHHIISSSGALLNWHRNIVGDSTSMRPGIDDAAMKGDAHAR